MVSKQSYRWMKVIKFLSLNKRITINNVKGMTELENHYFAISDEINDSAKDHKMDGTTGWKDDGF